MFQLFQPAYVGPRALDEGFSADLSVLNTSASTALTGWSTDNPYFSSSNFNATTGNYTVPVTGLYTMQAKINYTTNAAITASLGSSINPFFVIQRTSPTATPLFSGLLPIFDADVAILTLRAVLGNGGVTLTGVVSLTQGDVVNLYYDTDGMTIPITIQDTFWSAYRLA
ncbi:MAG: hypothetical protein LKJ17_10815 [Oscillospiraceae bacterium]|jgi:hypothetical protein|nr:hypothetical protein [Oscillospiraceae bacterium]